MHQLVPHFILENYAAGKMRGGFPAAGLFVDISGFSTITDALLTHGQHGAEVLAGVMRATFEPLIHSVFEQGGFIASHAGDAFTALFPLDGPAKDVCLRALSAAWNIQQHAGAHLQHTTPYGEFFVSAKVGLALGEVNWGILASGDGRRATYFFQGTTVDGCAEAEHQAQAGEIVLEAGLAGKIHGLAATQPAGDCFRLVSLSGALPAPQPAAPPEVNLDLAGRFFPRQLFTQAHGGEFRQVVNLFISLPTVRTETQLHIFMESLFGLQERYGGLLIRLDFGDKGSNLLLFWGIPATHENDLERALHFILELQAQTTIPINGGVTYTVAHAGFIGGDMSEEYTAFGRGVNLAARFMTAAPRGEIWLDENVAARVQSHYDLEYVDEMTFKGFAHKQKVYTLLERKEEAAPAYEGELVGREAELQALAEFVQPIFSGNYPGMLVVWGEAGMGKSRLVHELLSGLAKTSPARMRVFLAQADEILREALNPFRYWLKRYFGVSPTQVDARNKRSFNATLDRLITATQDRWLADELDRTRSFLGALVGLHWPDALYEQLDAPGRYENTFISVATLLQAESRQAPVVLFLEDAHWLDDDSKAFLLRLMRILTAEEGVSYPIAMIATTRFEGAGLPLESQSCVRSTNVAISANQQIDLSKLSRKALAALAEHQLGEPAGESLMDLLAKQAEGNPFFAEQTLRYLKENGRLVRDEGGWKVETQPEAPLPTDVRAVLVARLDRLAQEVKEVVQTAAVLGREFEVRLLAHMLHDDPNLPQKIAGAEQENIWTALSELRYIFKHTLMRDTAYDMQLRARRQSLHALAVEALESLYAGALSIHYGELAYHAEQAGWVENARRYLRLAGEDAKEAYQNSLALDYFSRALALTPEDDLNAHFELLLAREAIYELLGNIEQRQQDLAKLETLGLESGEPGKMTKVVDRLADYAYDTGDFPRTIELAQRASALALSINERETAILAQIWLSAALLHQGKLEEAAQHSKIGLELASKTQDRLNESRLLNTYGLICVEQENFSLGRSSFEQSLEFAREIGDLRTQAGALNNLGLIAGFQGDYAAAEDYYELSLALGRQIGTRSGEGIALGNLGWIAGSLGEYEKARAYAEQSIRIAREIDDPHSEALGFINSSAYAGALGDQETAVQCALQGQAIAHKIGEQSSEAWALTYLGHSRLALEQLHAAAGAYQAGLAIRQELKQPHLATELQAGLARVALAGGDLPTAERNLEAILAYLDGGGGLVGTDEPLRVYLTCYLVLDATGDERAGAILETAYNLLQARVASIKTEAPRQAFMQNIEYNRAILAAWEKQEGARSHGGAG